MCPDPETLALAEIASELRAFHCVTGQPRSCHTTPEGETYPYVTLGFRSDSLNKACAALCRSLQALRADCPSQLTLYLRSGPDIERDPESQDWAIRMRLAVPGGNWTNVTTKPEGLPYPKV
jgi:hypothetical protein